MEIDLSGRRALVTGGNSGIGEAIVRELVREGARVAVNFVVHPEKAEALVAELGAEHALAVEADVSDPDAVARMFGRIDAAWGGLDLLVNNAGVDGRRAPAWELAPADFRRVIEIDLLGPFLCAREALARMVPQGSGVVVNLTSVHEVIPWTGYSAYTAAKAGLAMLTKTLAQEAAPSGVRVFAVAPGAVKTPINREVWEDPDSYRDLVAKIPLGRIGEAAEVARMVAVLASDAATYLTGTTVVVDGGMTLYPSFERGG